MMAKTKDKSIGSVPKGDLTDEQVNPQPVIYPVCSTCEAPYVLRRAYSLSKGMMWVWQRDCKHKTADGRIHDSREDK
jgi:hypothetical protein